MKFRNDDELPKGEGSGGGVFIKLGDGQSVKGVFQGDPIDFMNAFKPGDKPSFRFRINLVVKENGAYVAKIFENGITVYRSLRALSETGYELDKHWYVISRSGNTKDTTSYSILPAPKGDLTPEDMIHVKSIRLNDLTPKAKGGSAPKMTNEEKSSQDSNAPADPDGDIPF